MASSLSRENRISLFCWQVPEIQGGGKKSICVVKEVPIDPGAPANRNEETQNEFYFAALAALMDSISSGTTLNRSPTIP